MATEKRTQNSKRGARAKKAGPKKSSSTIYETSDDVAEGNREEVEKSLQHQS